MMQRRRPRFAEDKKLPRHHDHNDDKELELLREIFHELKEIAREFRNLSTFLHQQYDVVQFQISQQEDFPMSIKGIAPGGTGTFTATPLNSSGTAIPLPAGMTLTWASDVSGAVITPDPANSLNAAIVLDATVTGGTVINLTVSATNPDGTPATGSAPVPVLSASVTVASFSIDQIT